LADLDFFQDGKDCFGRWGFTAGLDSSGGRARRGGRCPREKKKRGRPAVIEHGEKTGGAGKKGGGPAKFVECRGGNTLGKKFSRGPWGPIRRPRKAAAQGRTHRWSAGTPFFRPFFGQGSPDAKRAGYVLGRRFIIRRGPPISPGGRRRGGPDRGAWGGGRVQGLGRVYGLEGRSGLLSKSGKGPNPEFGPETQPGGGPRGSRVRYLRKFSTRHFALKGWARKGTGFGGAEKKKKKKRAGRGRRKSAFFGDRSGGLRGNGEKKERTGQARAGKKTKIKNANKRQRNFISGGQGAPRGVGGAPGPHPMFLLH